MLYVTYTQVLYLCENCHWNERLCDALRWYEMEDTGHTMQPKYSDNNNKSTTQ